MDIIDFIDPDTICLDLKAANKQDVFEELVDMLDSTGKLTNRTLFLDALWQREYIGNTGFDEGIAIPHAKSETAIAPCIAIGISQQGIDYGSETGECSDVFIMLASPDNNDDHHIEVLAQVSTKLVEDGFVTKLKKAKSKEEILSLFSNDSSDEPIFTPHSPTITKPSISHHKIQLRRVKQHLLYGTSHMIPFVVAGGVLLSLSVMLSGSSGLPQSGFLADVAKMGQGGLSLFTLVLGAYIAYSIADKPGLAPGMIGSWVTMEHYQTGFLGAIVVGFVAGFTVQTLKRIKLPESMASLSAIFIYPLVGTFITCGIVMWGIGKPISYAMEQMNLLLASMAGSGKIVLGSVLGAMTAFDMGGPINKIATLFAQTQINTQPWLMGGVGIAICTPPLGMALATWLSPRKFNQEEREAGKAAGIMGMIGISEGAIPFAASDPARVLPAVVAGGIVGNVTGFLFNVVNHAPWGGWIVLPVVDGMFGYIVGTLIGAMTTATIVISLKKDITQEIESTNTIESDTATMEEGTAEIVAVTSCPSGVAHTFLAARSLEKAASSMGIKIKVETQGANGIINRITDKDIQNARFAILANDVAIKNAERFNSIPTINVETKDAIHDPERLISKHGEQEARYVAQ
ncbi:fructose-specific PTS transporter subunit EIIC [Vibrio maerlii]|uniref:fructose-specific PTS transporter subunit EIIC n=1 Tax=Vibrio maerlii TaxID=2231648 RepID=UPI000E3C986C|nr:fructose-specific PTS transporter subunit EIIC [Vibrio maerlii]